jgi:hypothetical protein
MGSKTLDVDMRWFNNPLRGPLKSTKMEGKHLIDAKTGRLQSSEVRIDLQGDFKFGGGDNPGKMKVNYEYTLGLTAKP